MALVTNELYSSATQGSMVRVIPEHVEVCKFGDGSGTLAPLTPVGYDETNAEWGVWTAKTQEVNTITSNATPNTGGTFTLKVNGETTEAIAFNATAATIQAALEALDGIEPGDVTAVATAEANLGVASAVVTLTWGEKLAAQDIKITIDDSGLTGGSGNHALATSTAGVSAGGRHIIKGFVYPDSVVLSASGEVLGQVLKRGVVRYADIVLPSGETQANLDAALKDGPLARGLIIKGLAGVR